MTGTNVAMNDRQERNYKTMRSVQTGHIQLDYVAGTVVITMPDGSTVKETIMNFQRRKGNHNYNYDMPEGVQWYETVALDLYECGQTFKTKEELSRALTGVRAELTEVHQKWLDFQRTSMVELTLPFDINTIDSEPDYYVYNRSRAGAKSRQKQTIVKTMVKNLDNKPLEKCVMCVATSEAEAETRAETGPNSAASSLFCPHNLALLLGGSGSPEQLYNLLYGDVITRLVCEAKAKFTKAQSAVGSARNKFESAYESFKRSRNDVFDSYDIAVTYNLPEGCEGYAQEIAKADVGLSHAEIAQKASLQLTGDDFLSSDDDDDDDQDQDKNMEVYSDDEED